MPNRWSRESIARDDDWPLIMDLARAIGSPRWWAGTALLMFGLICVFAIARFDPRTAESSASEQEDASAIDREAVSSPIKMADENAILIPQAQAEIESAGVTSTIKQAAVGLAKSIRIDKGDTLMDAVVRAGADRIQAHAAITALSNLFDPRRLRIGQSISLTFSAMEAETNRLDSLSLRTRFDERVVAEYTDKGRYEAKKQPLPVTPLLSYASGTINDSLYLSAEREGVPAKVIIDLIRLYSFDVDFQREIRAGDSFEIVYERHVAEEDGLLENGDILFARLKLRNRDLPLYRHDVDGNGDIEYFNHEGKSVHKALMKTPLDGARLTSRFGKRKHPVLGYVRSHRGADFGAPTGTPVYAAGDGVIERASRYGSYGNYIRIRHNGTYKTAYAHLSRYGKGIRKGVRVKQGDVIGYVGATGRVTGAHLHYEVYVGKDRVDPLSLDLPPGRSLTGAVLTRFEDHKTQLDRDVAALGKTHRLVLADLKD